MATVTYCEQLTWLAQRFELSEDQTFSLDMQLHLMALQAHMFVFEVATQVIDIAMKHDAKKKVVVL